jgi:Ca2+/Na+ antiporter
VPSWRGAPGISSRASTRLPPLPMQVSPRPQPSQAGWPLPVRPRPRAQQEDRAPRGRHANHGSVSGCKEAALVQQYANRGSKERFAEAAEWLMQAPLPGWPLSSQRPAPLPPRAGLLLMSVMSILFPTILVAQHTEIRADASLSLSRTTSVLMLLCYTAYILFQLVTHKNLFDAPTPPPPALAIAGGGLEAGTEGGEEEEEEVVLGFAGGLVWLALVTLAISSLSDYLVNAIQGAAAEWGVPLAFLSVIVIPIANNVTEHAAAVVFAMKNKVDISLGIALGSSTQIAMFVLPLVVLVGWSLGLPLTLDFRVFATAVLFSSTLVVAYLLQVRAMPPPTPVLFGSAFTSPTCHGVFISRYRCLCRVSCSCLVVFLQISCSLFRSRVLCSYLVFLFISLFFVHILYFR